MMQETFIFIDDNDDIFDWKEYNEKENNLPEKAIHHRMNKFQDLKVAWNDEGCWVSNQVKEFCGLG